MVYSSIIAGVSAVVTLWRVFLKELTNGNVMGVFGGRLVESPLPYGRP